MLALRLLATRSPAMILAPHARLLSTQGIIAVEKLRNVLEQYRQQNYAQEIPMRFKKDIAKAATMNSADSAVALEGLKRVLVNIGAADRMTESEMKLIFEELGDGTKIPVQKITNIM